MQVRFDDERVVSDAISNVSTAEQDARLAAIPEFRDLLYQHAVEGAYAAPEYGGNHDLHGWQAIGFPGDVQPRGYTDAEVEGLE